MRLITSDVDNRLTTKLNRKIKASEGQAVGFMEFGENNDYPQLFERLINGSNTAKCVSDIYSNFLIGQGFENENINSEIVGYDSRGKEITLLSLLSQVSKSLAMYNGVYLHCNFTLDKLIKNIRLIPFKNCRFSKIDENGYCAFVYVYDWDLKKIDQNTLKKYNIFNVKHEVFAAQIRETDGIENFKGQVYYQFLDNQFIYPLNPFDPVYMDLDTENQISIFKNNSIRNGLLDKTIMRVVSPNSDTERQQLHNGVKSFLGADGDSVLILEDEVDPTTGEVKKNGAFALDKIESNINDKLFENWETTIQNNIRKAIRSVPKVFINYDEGIFGASGESIIQATNYYNAVTQDDRNIISKMFAEIFSNSENETLRNNSNWNIIPISLYENAKQNTLKDKKAESQAILRGSVGGVQAILNIQQSVSNGLTDISSAIAIMQEIFGISKKTAAEIIGTPKINPAVNNQQANII